MKTIFFYIIISCSCLYGDVLIIVSKDMTIKNFTLSEIKRIFLDRIKVLPNGEKIEAIELFPNHAKEYFYHVVMQKSKSQLRSYWAKQIFTGKGRPPKTIKAENFIFYMAKNKNMISYIPDDFNQDILNKVHVVYRIKE